MNGKLKTDDEIAIEAKKRYRYHDNMTESRINKLSSKRRRFIEGAIWTRDEAKSIISEQKAEIAEYRQRIEENVISIESMLHHNSVQKAEIERLRESIQKALNIKDLWLITEASVEHLNEAIALQSMHDEFITVLTKKEGNNG